MRIITFFSLYFEKDYIIGLNLIVTLLKNSSSEPIKLWEIGSITRPFWAFSKPSGSSMKTSLRSPFRKVLLTSNSCKLQPKLIAIEE